MRQFRPVLSICGAITVAIACALAGCTLGGQPKIAAVPPAPKPPVPAPAPAPELPLSLPQTVVELPSPQPIPPEALPPLEPIPAYVAETTPAPVAAKRNAPGRPPTQATQNEVIPLEPPSSAPEDGSPRPRFEAVDPTGDHLPSVDKINSRLEEVKKLRAEVERRKLTLESRMAVNRVDSFVKLSHSAIARGDLRQADALAQRALVIVRDLTRGR